MKARFIGDPLNGGEGPQALSVAGVILTRYQWTPVPLEIAAKVRGNSHFDIDDEEDEAAPRNEIEVAIELLDPANDDHWTREGLPAVDAVKSILGRDVTRAEIAAAAPDYTRPAAD